MPPNFPLGVAPRTCCVPDTMLLPSPLPPPFGTTCHLSLEFSCNLTGGPLMTLFSHMTLATSLQVSTEARPNCDSQTTPQSFSPGHPGRPRVPGALSQHLQGTSRPRPLSYLTYSQELKCHQ